MSNENTSRKGIKLLIPLSALLLLLGTGGTLFLLRADPQLSKIKELQQRLVQNKLTPEQRAETWRQLHTEFNSFTPQQRQQFLQKDTQNGIENEYKREKVLKYLGMETSEERDAFVQQDIAESQARQQHGAWWRSQQGMGNGGNGGRLGVGNWPGNGNGSVGVGNGGLGNGNGDLGAANWNISNGGADNGNWGFGSGGAGNAKTNAGIAGGPTGQGNIKSFFSPYHGANLKLGRKRPVDGGPRLNMGNYITGTQKTQGVPPLTCDYFTAASQALSRIYLNNQLGDCVIAGMAHVVGVMTGNAGTSPYIFSKDQIIALYSAIGGYVPGDPNTDNGCDEITALKYWKQQGAPAGSNQITGWMSVNPQNPHEYRLALWLFENLYFGLELPDAWLSNVAPGFVWQAATPDPWNGHCVIGCGYDETGVKIATWGMLGTLTDGAINQVVTPQYYGQLFVVISEDTINKATQKAPNGLNWNQLMADFKAMFREQKH